MSHLPSPPIPVHMSVLASWPGCDPTRSYTFISPVQVIPRPKVSSQPYPSPSIPFQRTRFLTTVILCILECRSRPRPNPSASATSRCALCHVRLASAARKRPVIFGWYASSRADAVGMVRVQVIIGINSFGFGGANGHCIIEEYKLRFTWSSVPKLIAVRAF